MANDLTDLTAGEFLDATKTLGSITELVLLDRFWTEEARTLGDPAATRSPDRIGGLGSIVDEMERRLLEIAQLANRIAAVGNKKSAQLETNFQALVADTGPLTADQRAKVIELVDSRSQGDVLAFVQAAAADVASQLDPERKLLKDEFKRISGGGPSNGDLSAEEERALAELAILVSIVAGPEAGVIVEAVGHLIDFLFG